LVAVVGYQQLATALREDADQTLKRAGDSLSHELLGRLEALESDLDRLDQRLAIQSGPWPRALLNDLAQSFSQITYRGDRERHILLGSAVDLPVLDAVGQARLDAGHTLVSVSFGTDGPPSLLLARRGARGLWTARARIAWLIPSWDDQARAVSTEFCALDGSERVVGCSSAAFAGLDLLAIPGAGAVGSASFALSHAEESYLAQRLKLTLAPKFFDPTHAAPWAVVVVIPRGEVFGPLNAFRRTFTLLATLTIAFATLVSLTQIRRQLVPLEQLRQGTRRLAEGDFDFSLSIRSGDDFEELADSFNQMTRTLHRQFDSLQRMVEIDRSILSEITATRVLDTLVERVGELFPARVAVALVAEGDGVLSTAHNRVGATVREHLGELSSTLLESWFPGAEPRRLASEDAHPCTPLLERYGDLRWTAIPLRFHADLVAVLLLGSEEEPSADEELFARQLAAQCSVALANARTLERNRVLAYYDSLTELPNRLLYRERLNQALRRARRHSQTLAVVILDLDDFKRINDTLGHDAGDRLLCQIAGRLQSEAADSSGTHAVAPTIARAGGDEFMVLLEEIEGIGGVARAADRLRQSISGPDRVDGHDVMLSASAGIAMYPDDGDDLETLMRSADIALHHAKEHGRDRYEFFDPSMNKRAANRLETEAGLRRALELNQLRVFYQPIVNAEDRAPVGMEALVRWQHPERGLIYPGEFIGVAESTGLILKLGEVVMRRACAQSARFQRELGIPLRLAINASPRQLRESALVTVVLDALREGGLSPSCLTLEITEGIVAEANPELLDQLASLKHAGVRIAIDDFGTGYSSLAYLKQFPVDILKIDQSFTAGITAHREDRAIVQSVISMAHGLGLGTVVEGVEREDQLALLRELGCEHVQGQLFAAPMAADEFVKWVREQSPDGA
jgi:diguanylate cyclase (GGDEF)-like protein